jgi:hypothetical protein
MSIVVYAFVLFTKVTGLSS